MFLIKFKEYLQQMYCLKNNFLKNICEGLLLDAGYFVYIKISVVSSFTFSSLSFCYIYIHLFWLWQN